MFCCLFAVHLHVSCGEMEPFWIRLSFQGKSRRMPSPLMMMMMLGTMMMMPLRTEAMEVSAPGPQTVQKALGETVKLGCIYTPGTQDTGELDIEWSSLNPDMTQRDQLVLSYTGGKMHQYGDPGVSARFTFTGNPTQGDASIAVSDLRGSDTATYQCKVKKAPGVDMRKVTLVVLVPPSTPKCWVEGPEEKGGPVSLRCKSSEGTIPISYTWSRESGGSMPLTATQNPESGELLINNHTEANIGNYACEARNSVGSAQCKYALHAYNPTNKVGVIVGAVIGAILLLLLLLLLLWLLCCCCRKRRYEKEVANEIREDTRAPESRPSSRHSSLRSVLGYRTHAGVYYSSVQNLKSGIRESARNVIYTGDSNGTPQPSNGTPQPSNGTPQPSNGTPQPSNGTPQPSNSTLTRLNYDHKYGYPV